MKTEEKSTNTIYPDFDESWDYNDPEGTEAKFRDFLASAEEDDLSYRAQLLTQIARTMGLRRDFDGAHALLDSVQSMLSPGLPIAQIRYLLERGRTYNSNNETQKASELFRKAYHLADEHSADFYTVDAAHMLGISEPQENRMEWNLTALKIAKSSADEKARNWQGSLYNNIGWTYHDEGQYSKALEMFEGALEFREEQGDTSSIQIAKWCIGRANRSLGKFEDALHIQQQLLKDAELLGLAPDGYTYEEIGENLLALNKREEAKPYFKKAHELLSKDGWLVANESSRLERLETLSQ